ncbi:MAG: CpsD/CapB family tyrosine-protein kinase [Rhodospirillales bacterium]
MEKIQRALEKARRQRESGLSSGAVAVGSGHSQREAAVQVPPASLPVVTKTLAVAPEVLKAHRLVAGIDGVAITDAFRMLRTQVMQRLQGLQASTLAITSPGAGEGKTLLAANLAIMLSRFAHFRVLLVDLDLRRPAMHATFGLPRTKGVTDILLRDVPVGDCLINPGIERLVLLPCGAGSTMSSELLSSPRMADLAAELKTRYPDRIVVYDLPPLLLTDDVLVFLKHVEACLLVVEQGATHRDAVERCLELLQDFNLIGTVLNKSRSARDGYGYGYGYGY